MYYLIFNETSAMSLHHLIAIYNEYVLDQQCANCHKEILYFSNFDVSHKQTHLQHKSWLF